ncbi:MAG: PaaI family thioesterase [Pseudomonadota bacterium]
MTQTFEPRNPNFESRVRTMCAAQSMMQTLGITVDRVVPGKVELVMDFNEAALQHHSYHHAGVATSGMDTACGFAANTLMAAGVSVLTVEFKASFLAPATGDRFRFIGTVTKAGRTLTFCEGQAFAETDPVHRSSTEPQTKLIATLSATMIAVPESS